MISRKTVRHIVLFGPPGVGKGVQAKLLSDFHGLGYLSTGERIRAEIELGSEFGKRFGDAVSRGQFVDDETMVALVQECVQGEEFRRGFILDGFPRTVNQARSLDQHLRHQDASIECALFLGASEETILERLSGRLVCSQCEESYHSAFRRPTMDSVCDECGAPVIRRRDDDPAVCRRRLKIYQKETAPLVEYYDAQGVLRRVDSDRPVEAVADSVRRAVLGVV